LEVLRVKRSPKKTASKTRRRAITRGLNLKKKILPPKAIIKILSSKIG